MLPGEWTATVFLEGNVVKSVIKSNGTVGSFGLFALGAGAMPFSHLNSSLQVIYLLTYLILGKEGMCMPNHACGSKRTT